MKPLISIQVKRGQPVSEWIPSAHQATDAGRNDFWLRQQERMKQQQDKPNESLPS
jgi:hypothetical protein